MVNFLTRLIRWPTAVPELPPKCLAGCGALRAEQELLANGRVYCQSCGKDYAAWQDEKGDWKADARPLRHVLRRGVAKAS